MRQFLKRIRKKLRDWRTWLVMGGLLLLSIWCDRLWILQYPGVVLMQHADRDGSTIPAGTLRGTAVLSSASVDPQWINAGVSVGIFNVSTATCGQRCPNCSDYSDFEVLPYNSSSYFAAIGGTAAFQSWGFAQDGLWHNVTSLSSWTSDNTSVATSQGVGGYNGVSSRYI